MGNKSAGNGKTANDSPKKTSVISKKSQGDADNLFVYHSERLRTVNGWECLGGDAWEEGGVRQG
jgi:hypothetical protein